MAGQSCNPEREAAVRDTEVGSFSTLTGLHRTPGSCDLGWGLGDLGLLPHKRIQPRATGACGESQLAREQGCLLGKSSLVQGGAGLSSWKGGALWSEGRGFPVAEAELFEAGGGPVWLGRQSFLVQGAEPRLRYKMPWCEGRGCLAQGAELMLWHRGWGQ